MYALEVIVDAIDRLGRYVVTQNRSPRTAFIRSQVQGDQIRPLDRTPTDRTEVNFGRRHDCLTPR
jgi:hypothetical protein